MSIRIIQKKKHLFRLTAIFTTVSLFSYMRPRPIYAVTPQPREIIVAVIDTGVNTEHDLLKTHIWVNNAEIPGNGLDDDRNGYIDDIYGWDFYNNDATVFHDKAYTDSDSSIYYEDDHGTHVAGLIVSAAERCKEMLNGKSTYDIKIMVLKISGGEDSSGSTANAVKAIKYAENKGAVICNLSWGSNENDGALKRVMERSDMLFVCCAGNEGLNNDVTPVYPAGYEYDNVLAVTGAEIGEEVRLTGNYGRLDVDICADGIDRMSSVSHGWGFKSGASMATAEVCGTAAAVMSAARIGASETRKLLIETSDHIPNVTRVTLAGGLCNEEKAMARMLPLAENEAYKTPAGILLNYNEISVDEGRGFTLKCLALPGIYAAAEFISSDDEVATVSYNGLVICKKKGDAMITVKLENCGESACLVHVR